jgi:hypothetical protein
MNISAGTSLGVFAGITAIYFSLKYILIENYDIINGGGYPHGLSNVLNSVYYVLIVFAQYYINVQNSYTKCGESQIYHSVVYTIIPNVLIFGLLTTMLDMFPGFLKPFSNTIGYFFVYWLGGISGIFNKMLVSKDKSRYIQQVYDDNSMMINEITTGKYGNIMNFFREGAKPGNNQIFNTNYKMHLPKVFNRVVIKDLISKFIWYALVGGLVISTSFNSIMNMECSRSQMTIEKMEKANKSFEKEAEKESKKLEGQETEQFF